MERRNIIYVAAPIQWGQGFDDERDTMDFGVMSLQIELSEKVELTKLTPNGSHLPGQVVRDVKMLPLRVRAQVEPA